MDGRQFDKVEGSEFELDADLVLLAMGFVGPERPGLLTDLGVELDDAATSRGPELRDHGPGVFVAGDMGRGQSLIVWAIAEGRAAAAGVDAFLMARPPCRRRSRRPPRRNASHICHIRNI